MNYISFIIFIFFLSSNKHDNICIHVKKVHKLRGHRDDTTVLPDVLKLQRQFILEQFAKVKVDSTKVRKPYQRMDSSGKKFKHLDLYHLISRKKQLIIV